MNGDNASREGKNTNASYAEADITSATKDISANAEQRLLAAKKRSEELKSEIRPHSEGELKQQIESLPQHAQQEIWQRIMHGEIFATAHPLAKKLGITELLASCRPDPNEKVKTGPKWKVWSNEWQTAEQVFIGQLGEMFQTSIFYDPNLPVRGRAVQGSADSDPYIMYGKPMPSVSERLKSLAEYGLLDLWNSVLIHEQIHVTRRKTTQKIPHTPGAIPQVAAERASLLKTEDEANALLSDPGYFVYDLLPRETREHDSVSEFVDQSCYSNIAKEDFAHAIESITKLQALGLDSLQIATLIGEGKNIDVVISDKLHENGIDEETLKKLVEARKLETNNARLQLMQQVRQLVQDNQTLTQVRTSIDAIKVQANQMQPA